MTVLEQARILHESARYHKRLRDFHRSEAKTKMQELAAFCERFGLDLQIIKAEGETNHGRQQQQPDRNTA